MTIPRSLPRIVAAMLILAASFGVIAGAQAAPLAGHTVAAPHFKDGKSDDDDGDSSGGGGDSSDDGSNDSSDDSSGSSGSDDNGSSDDSSGRGSDDSSDDESGHGNDDFLQDDSIDSSDGAQVLEVDDDNNDQTDGFRAGQAIVHLQPTASIDAFNARYGTVTVAGVVSENLYLVELPAGQSEDAAMRALAADPETRWVELNYVNQAPEGRPGYFFVSGSAAPELGEPYAASLIGYDAAARSCSTGAGVLVAVLDTGVDASHPALEGRIARGGWNALNNSDNVDDAGNGIDDDGDGMIDEMVGHGTHVAGIIAQVAPDASILPVKVLGSDGAGDAFYVAAGIYYAVDRGADVINLSLSSTYDARVVAEAVAFANEQGVVVVAAAGNNGTDRVLEFPAADTGVLAVASTNQADVKSDFSNFGEQIDLAAPGEAIVSALPGGQYAAWSGTSMAAPFVAGAAALIAQQQPDWQSPEIARRLTETAAALDAANPTLSEALGSGRLDIAAALDC